jgi:hypothetical protein
MGEVNVDALIRNVCQRLAKEDDPGKIEMLAGELRNVVDTEQDETRLRLRYIAQRYRDRVRAVASQRPETEHRSQLRAVIAFLGIGSKMNDGQMQN